MPYPLSTLLVQLAWALPSLIVLVTIAALAIVRRDDGLWWKLVSAGAAVMVLGQLLSVTATLVVFGIDRGYRLSWLLSVPSTVLHAVGLALLGAGALVGRRSAGSLGGRRAAGTR